MFVTYKRAGFQIDLGALEYPRHSGTTQGAIR